MASNRGTYKLLHNLLTWFTEGAREDSFSRENRAQKTVFADVKARIRYFSLVSDRVTPKNHKVLAEV